MKRSRDLTPPLRGKKHRSLYIDHDDYSSPEMDRRGNGISRPLNNKLPSLRNRGFDYDSDKTYNKRFNRNDDYLPDNDKVYRSLCVSGICPSISDNQVRDAILEEFDDISGFNIKLIRNANQRIVYINFRDPEDAYEAYLAHPKISIYDRPARIEPVYLKNKNRNNMNYSNSMNPYNKYRDRYDSRMSPELRDTLSNRSLSPPSRRIINRDDDRRYREAIYDRDSNSGAGFNEGPAMRRPHKEPKFPHHLHHIPPEDDENATRTLFIGNLDLNISDMDIRHIFDKYGYIEDVDVKKPSHGQGNAYAFVRFFNVDMAHKAKTGMSGNYIGKFQCKIGYGKANPTNCIWVGGIGPWVKLEVIETEFDRFGAITDIEWPSGKECAYIMYDNVDAAQAAVKEMRGFPLGGKDHRIRVDFTDPAHIELVRTNPNCDEQRMDPEDWKAAERDWEAKNRDVSDFREKSRDSYNDRGDNNSEKSFGRLSRSPDSRRERRRRYPSEGEDRLDFYDKTGNGDHNSSTALPLLYDVLSLSDLTKSLPEVWNGVLMLKNSGFPSKMYHVKGNVNLVDNLMKEPGGGESRVLKITQRLRLHAPKLEDVTNRITTVGPAGYCVLLAVPGKTSAQDDATCQHRPLRNLVSYLKQKESAGVISCIGTRDKEGGVLHAFPPCDFGQDFLLARAPGLGSEPPKEDHLVVIVINGQQS